MKCYSKGCLHDPAMLVVLEISAQDPHCHWWVTCWSHGLNMLRWEYFVHGREKIPYRVRWWQMLESPSDQDTSHENGKEEVSPDQPSLASRLPALAAGAGATVTASVLSSYMGTSGTIIGMAGGSIVSGAAAMYYERWIRAGHAVVKQRRGAPPVRQTRPQHGTGGMSALLAGIHWKTAAVVTGGTLVISAGAVTAAEAMAGKPMAAVVQGDQGHGTSLGGGTVSPPSSSLSPSSLPSSPSVSPSVSVSPSPSPSPSATPSVTPSPSPSVSLSSPPVSVSPTSVPAPAVTVSTSPSAAVPSQGAVSP